MILYAKTPDGLATKVSDALEQNWHPCGGVAVATVVTSVDTDGRYTNAISFYQAVMREGGPPIIIHTSALYT